MQAELSEKQAAVAKASSQLQQQQERYIILQQKAEADSKEAARAAATQTERYKKLGQQMQEERNAAQKHRDGLQSVCDAQGKKVQDLTAELSAAKASVKQLQVSCVSVSETAANVTGIHMQACGKGNAGPPASSHCNLSAIRLFSIHARRTNRVCMHYTSPLRQTHDCHRFHPVQSKLHLPAC